MKQLIKKNLNGKTILFLFALASTVYAAMLFITIPQVMQFSKGMQLLDLMPTGYSHSYVTALFETLGPEGRSLYLYRQIPLDLLYPGLFAVSFCLVMAYLLKKLGKLESYYFYLCLLPLFAGAFDYGENIGIISMLSRYPNNSPGLSQITSLFSILKSSITTFYFISLTLVLLVLAKRKVSKS